MAAAAAVVVVVDDESIPRIWDRHRQGHGADRSIDHGSREGIAVAQDARRTVEAEVEAVGTCKVGGHRPAHHMDGSPAVEVGAEVGVHNPYRG